jgi:SAM-dependent methyltransferase
MPQARCSWFVDGETPSGASRLRLLNVGGNTKAIPLPPRYAEFEHVLLDIDPTGGADIVCDARDLSALEPKQFDAVYCSHNLEHYYRHDVPCVLAGFLHVLKDGAFAHIRVPDVQEVMKITTERGLDIDDVLYQSPAGPIMVLDVIYGYSVEIERSGQDFFAHKTGFTQKSLRQALSKAGFSTVDVGTGNLEINAIAFKGTPDPAAHGVDHDAGPGRHDELARALPVAQPAAVRERQQRVLRTRRSGS